MSQPIQQITTGPTLGHIPGAPTVGFVTTATGARRFGRLSEEVIAYYKRVAAEALNDFAVEFIAEPSLREVPRGPDLGDELANSIRHPGNDPATAATEDFLVADVSYNTEYADAQEEGVATMVHHHPIIPGSKGFFEKTDISEEIVVEWKATHYTTPGTKSHFLRDPYMAAVLELEPYIYRRVREAFLG